MSHHPQPHSIRRFLSRMTHQGHSWTREQLLRLGYGAETILKELLTSGAVECYTTPARVPSLTEPLLVIEPNSPATTAQINALVNRRRRQWAMLPLRTTTIYYATKNARLATGGACGRRSYGGTLTHDLAVTEVSLAKLWAGAGHFVHEAMLPAGSAVVPDGILITRRSATAIEVVGVGGSYRPETFLEFLEYYRFDTVELW